MIIISTLSKPQLIKNKKQPRTEGYRKPILNSQVSFGLRRLICAGLKYKI